jgi:hypothetical protein
MGEHAQAEPSGLWLMTVTVLPLRVTGQSVLN